ncbi:MAG: Tyrosine--tRNA ligase [Patescibacteria group bacterium]|nr:Tyrosine--tRNA ligase [Patescibacteria group bacterium]
MKEISTKNQIDEILTRGVGEFIDPEGIFRKKLENNPEKIVIKLGVDPTRPDIHLGHAVILHKLRRLQDLGCKVIFLIGDITAQIGDPTGKSKIRPEIDYLEIQKNMKTYLDQVDKILLKDEKVFSWTMNSDWFVSINDIVAPDNMVINMTAGEKKFSTPPLPGNNIFAKAHHWEKTRIQKGNINSYTFINLLSILRKISYSRLIERDMFQDRIKNGEPVYMHEMMYPIIQGIDSNAIANIFGSCDLEVGGTDQHFNMLMGREIMEMNGKIPQAVISFKILEGLDGKEKMSKSLDNYVGITDEPADMYGKIMSIPDSSIVNYYELCTFTPLDGVEEIEKKLEEGKENPKNLKMQLAKQIVAIYHGEKKSEEAEDSFVNTFQKGEIPEEMTEVNSTGETLMDLLVLNKIVASKGEYRRLVDEGAVTDLDKDEKVEDVNLVPEKGNKFRLGKKRFIKIV